MSVTMGWTEPPPTMRRESSAVVGGGLAMSPIRAPTADRHMSLAIPDKQYRTEAASKRFTRKMSLRPGWMDTQSPPIETEDDHDAVLAAALAALEGLPPANASPAKIQGPSISGPSEATLRNMKRMSMAKRTSFYAQDPDTNRVHVANVRTYYQEGPSQSGVSSFQQGNGLLGARMDYHEESLSPAVEIHLPDMTDATTRRMKRMSTKRISIFLEKDIPEIVEMPMINFQDAPIPADQTALENALAASEGAAPTSREEQPITSGITELTPRMMKRMSNKRISQFMDNDIPEVGEMPIINFQNLPSQTDPAALDDALATLEGAHSPVQESHVAEIMEATPRRMKRMSAKRVSLYLEDDIPEATETEPISLDIPADSRRRKASVEYALAALEAPTPPQANMGRPRRPEAAVRSRKTMSMYVDTDTSFTTSRAATNFPEPRSFFDTDPPETEYESTSRKLKRMSWNVIGRALPHPRLMEDVPFVSNIQEHSSASQFADSYAPKKAKRMSWLPTVRPTPEPPASTSYGMATTFAWDQPASIATTQRRVEPVPRKTNRSSWYSMDPTVAEIQCSPRREYGPPAPWLEPVVQPTRPVEPSTAISRNSKRTSWYPVAREVQPELPSPLHEVAPDVTGVPEESVEDMTARKKMNRMSKFVFSQGPRKKYAQEVFPQLGGPLNSHPASCNPSRPETPVRTPHLSRMKKLGAQLGRLFR